MQHLQYGMKSLSKFAISLPCLLLRIILRHITLLVPSLIVPPYHLSRIATLDSALAVGYARDVLYCMANSPAFSVRIMHRTAVLSTCPSRVASRSYWL